MSSQLADFLFELVNLLLLAAGMGWVFFRPVRAAIDRERAQRSKTEHDASAAKAEADRLLKEAQEARDTHRAELDAERERLISEARTRAQAIVEAARADASERRAKLARELDLQRREELAASEVALADLVGRSVERLLASIDGPELQLALTRTACARARALSAAGRQDVTVEVASSLTDASRALLSQTLTGGFDVRLVPELGAGVRLITSEGQVDATALGIARAAVAQTLKRLQPTEADVA